MERLTAHQTLEILDHQWLSAKDIKKVACVGIGTARLVLKDIAKQINKEDKLLPKNLVPTEKVIEYFGINVNYLRKLENKGE